MRYQIVMPHTKMSHYILDTEKNVIVETLKNSKEDHVRVNYWNHKDNGLWKPEHKRV